MVEPDELVLLLRAVLRRYVFSLDNHLTQDGQADRIAGILAAASGVRLPRLQRFAVEGLPVRGANTDVLRRHGVDAATLCQPQTPSVELEAFPNSFGADTGL